MERVESLYRYTLQHVVLLDIDASKLPSDIVVEINKCQDVYHLLRQRYYLLLSVAELDVRAVNYAVEEGDERLVKFLLTLNIDVTSANLCEAVKHQKILAMLVEAGACDWETATEGAVYLGDDQLVEHYYQQSENLAPMTFAQLVTGRTPTDGHASFISIGYRPRHLIEKALARAVDNHLVFDKIGHCIAFGDLERLKQLDPKDPLVWYDYRF